MIFTWFEWNMKTHYKIMGQSSCVDWAWKPITEPCGSPMLACILINGRTRRMKTHFTCALCTYYIIMSVKLIDTSDGTGPLLTIEGMYLLLFWSQGLFVGFHEGMADQQRRLNTCHLIISSGMFQWLMYVVKGYVFCIEFSGMVFIIFCLRHWLVDPMRSWQNNRGG